MQSPATLILQRKWVLLNVTVFLSPLNTASDAEVFSVFVPGFGAAELLRFF